MKYSSELQTSIIIIIHFIQSCHHNSTLQCNSLPVDLHSADIPDDPFQKEANDASVPYY